MGRSLHMKGGLTSAVHPTTDIDERLYRMSKGANKRLMWDRLARRFFIPISIAVCLCGMMFVRAALDEGDAGQHQRGAGDLR